MSRRAATADAPPDLARWGKSTPEEHAAASDLLEKCYTDAVRKADMLGITGDAIGSLGRDTLARLFFMHGDEAGLPPVALLRAALADLPDEGTRRLDEAQIEAVALDVFGEPEAPARLTDFTHAGTVPAWVYDSLPGPLKRLCLTYDAGEQRDTFLVSALGCVAAALPGLAFRYARKWSRCNLFLAVVAPSGAGKAPLIAAGRLLQPINDYLLSVSDAEIGRWEAAQAARSEPAGALLPGMDDLPRECPPSRYISFGGDIADAEFFLATHANGGHGAIIESEIATLLATMGKEWGNFRPKLLKGYENEITTYARTRRRPLIIPNPEITLVTSGTPAAFTEWIRDNEDGLFNRTGFYAFDAFDGWRSGWDDDNTASEEMEEAEGALAAVLLRAYKQLTGTRADPDDEFKRRRVPLVAVFEADQKRRLDEAFAAQKLSLPALGLAPLANYTHRMALSAARIAAGLAALRLACDRHDLGLPVKSYRVGEDDFRTGLQLGVLLMAHGIELARRHFRGVETAVPTGKRKETQSPSRRFLDELGREFGDAPFRRGDAVPSVIERIGMKSRKGDAYLAELVGQGFLERVTGAQGLYQRTEKAPAPAALVAQVDGPPPVPVGFVPAHLLFPPTVDGVAEGDGPPLDALPEIAADASADPDGDAPF